MTKERALLMVKVDPPAGRESEWNNWYNNSHVAERLAIPGFLSARRFTLVEGIPKPVAVAGEAKYLALYDLENVRVMNDEPYLRLRQKQALLPPDSFDAQIAKLPKFARGVYQQVYPEPGQYAVPAARFVFVVGHDVPRSKEKEFNVWSNTEHLPALLAVPGFLTGRRFVLAQREIPPIVGPGGTLSKYLTVYDIENESVFESQAFLKASTAPWITWVRTWYTRKICALFRRIYPED